MTVNDLLMMNYEDIDYHSLPDDTLKKLALSEELFIATAALAELARRKSSLAEPVAWHILSQSLGDRYLQAAALRVLFNMNQERVLEYLNCHSQRLDPDVLHALMELMVENEPYFTSGAGLSMVRSVSTQLAADAGDTNPIDPEVRQQFLKMYNQLIY